MIEFRLHSEGSNKNPLWGIAFRHKIDVINAIDIEKEKRPSQIDIEFPNGTIHTFGIRPCFWTGCYEFVDAQVRDKTTGLPLKTVKPIKSLAIERLGYDVRTKNKCNILIEVVKRNRFLRIVTFE